MRGLGQVEVCAIREIGKDQFVGQTERRIGGGRILSERGNVVVEVVEVEREVLTREEDKNCGRRRQSAELNRLSEFCRSAAENAGVVCDGVASAVSVERLNE